MHVFILFVFISIFEKSFKDQQKGSFRFWGQINYLAWNPILAHCAPLSSQGLLKGPLFFANPPYLVYIRTHHSELEKKEKTVGESSNNNLNYN